MLVTKTRLETFASKERQLRKSTTASILHESAVSTDSYDIFLSHSVMDADLILGVKALLESYDFTVYVDWVDDPKLVRSQVNKRSAQTLRQRMKTSQMMLYAHTINSAHSKWCPWELGFFDGHHQGNVFILPISQQSRHSFDGQEYLSLYPYVDEEKDRTGVRKLWINRAGEETPLTQARSKTFAPLRE